MFVEEVNDMHVKTPKKTYSTTNKFPLSPDQVIGTKRPIISTSFCESA